jgi:hypothetical protein
MKTIILTILFTGAYLCSVKAQTVIASAGNFVSGTSVSLSWTMGEALTETFSSANSVLTQGFHQPDFTVSEVSEFVGKNPEIRVYPNPVVEYLNIDFGTTGEEYIISLYDMNGNVILNKPVMSGQTTISVGQLACSSYLLYVKDAKGEILKTWKIARTSH